MTSLRIIVYAYVAISICHLCANVPPTPESSAATTESAVRLYLFEVHEALGKSGAAGQLWQQGGESGAYPPGGIVERIILPVVGKEKIMLLRSSLDDRLTPTQTNPPVPESFRVFVANGSATWIPQPMDGFGIVEGGWIWQRLRNKQCQYGLKWGRRDVSPRVEVYTAVDGKLLLVERRGLPSQDDILAKYDELSEEDFKKWLAKAEAPPSDMKRLEAKREWISLAELIGGSSEWHAGEPDIGSLPSSGNGATWEQFSRWLRR